MTHRSVSILTGVILFGAALVPSVKADEWNKKTILTINEAIQMPSCCTPDHVVTLQPGTYVLVLVDSLSDRHIVRVFDKNQEHVLLTTLAIPNYRLQPSEKSSFGFWETPAGQPRAMRAWFYPGDNFGQEFAYPKNKSIEIARVALASVPAIAVEVVKEADRNTFPVVIVEEQCNEAPVTAVAASEPPPVPAPAPAPAVEVAAAPQAEPVSEPAPATLPETGSPFPLIGLIGFASLAVSRLMSRFSKSA
jgi:hypothetical protein